MINSELLLGLPDNQINGMERVAGQVRIRGRHAGPVICPGYACAPVRSKGCCDRTLRHEDRGLRRVVLELEARKCQCLGCGRNFRQLFAGIWPARWSTASDSGCAT